MRDVWGIRITEVNSFLQGYGSILCSANCTVTGVSNVRTLDRASSIICIGKTNKNKHALLYNTNVTKWLQTNGYLDMKTKHYDIVDAKS